MTFFETFSTKEIPHPLWGASSIAGLLFEVGVHPPYLNILLHAIPASELCETPRVHYLLPNSLTKTEQVQLLQNAEYLASWEILGKWERGREGGEEKEQNILEEEELAGWNPEEEHLL